MASRMHGGFRTELYKELEDQCYWPQQRVDLAAEAIGRG
jgi:hypothetical protein